MVFPPPGRNFGGGASSAARAAMGGPGIGPPGFTIDAMDDFRFRAGGRKHIKIEDMGERSYPFQSLPSMRPPLAYIMNGVRYGCIARDGR